jgi:hypothetical protein
MPYNTSKILDKLKVVNNGLQGQIHREIECQSQLYHQNVAHMYAYIFDHKEYLPNTRILLQWCIVQFASKKGLFTEETLAKYTVKQQTHPKHTPTTPLSHMLTQEQKLQ